MWRRTSCWTKCWVAGWMKCCWTGTQTSAPLLRLRRHFPKAALKLTDDQWMYLSEMYDGGMSVTEIAAVHDVNKSTVSRSVNRAKKTLRDYLQFCL